MFIITTLVGGAGVYAGTKFVSYLTARIRGIPERNIIETLTNQHGK